MVIRRYVMWVTLLGAVNRPLVQPRFAAQGQSCLVIVVRYVVARFSIAMWCLVATGLDSAIAMTV